MRKPTLEEVEKATHEQLAIWWRFLPAGSILKGEKVSERLKDRLFQEFDGITPEISKKIGWK